MLHTNINHRPLVGFRHPPAQDGWNVSGLFLRLLTVTVLLLVTQPLLAETHYDPPTLNADHYERTQPYAEIKFPVVIDPTATAAVRFDWYKPGGILYSSALQNGSGSWWYYWWDFPTIFSSRLPFTPGDAPTVLLGRWSVKVFLNLGQGWEAVAEKFFEIQAPDRYRYQATLSQDLNESYPYRPLGETTQFYTSAAKTNGHIIAAANFEPA